MPTNKETAALNVRIAALHGSLMNRMMNGDHRETFTHLLACVECGSYGFAITIHDLEMARWDASTLRCSHCRTNPLP